MNPKGPMNRWCYLRGLRGPEDSGYVEFCKVVKEENSVKRESVYLKKVRTWAFP